MGAARIIAFARWPGFLRGALRRLGYHAERALALLGLASLVWWFCFDLGTVTSESMRPLLLGTNIDNGDWLLSEKLSYRFRRPRRWEVVSLTARDGTRVVKRIVGLPGERVRIPAPGVLEIDGRRLDLPPRLAHVRYLPQARLARGRSMACGSGYFALGDDSADSADSRFDGPFPPESVRSRAWLIVRPRGRMGPVQ